MYKNNGGRFRRTQRPSAKFWERPTSIPELLARNDKPTVTTRLAGITQPSAASDAT